MDFQQQAALMAAATAQGTYINPMAALATQIPHATLNGMANSVVPPTSGNPEIFNVMFLTICQSLRNKGDPATNTGCPNEPPLLGVERTLDTQ